jgi:hypothetical protein
VRNYHEHGAVHDDSVFMAPVSDDKIVISKNYLSFRSSWQKASQLQAPKVSVSMLTIAAPLLLLLFRSYVSSRGYILRNMYLIFVDVLLFSRSLSLASWTQLHSATSSCPQTQRYLRQRTTVCPSAGSSGVHISWWTATGSAFLPQALQ